MSTMILPAHSGDAFTEYRPSKNAHVDILSSSSKGKDKKEGVRVIKLALPRPSTTSKDLLSALLTSISPILAGTSTTQSFHYLSSACHKLVLPPHSLGPTIYTRIKEEIDKSIATLAREWRGSIMSREAGWLNRLISGWTTYDSRISLLSAVFVYLDRIYANEVNGISSIQDLAMASFKKGIWENPIILDKTREDFLAWAAGERKEEMENMELRSTIVQLTGLADLLAVFPTLSTPYREATREYYTDNAKENIESVEKGVLTPSKYVAWALEKAEEERSRGLSCVSETDAYAAQQIVRIEAGTNMRGLIVRRALDEAMDAADEEALHRLYQLVVDVDVFGDMVIALEGHLDDRLTKLISDPTNDSQMIESTLRIKRFADQSVASLFSAPADPVKASKKGRKTHRLSDCTLNAADLDVRDVRKNRLTTREGYREISIDDRKIRRMGQSEPMSPNALPPAMFSVYRPRIEPMPPQDGQEYVDDNGPHLPPATLSSAERLRQLELEDAIRNGFKSGMGSRQNAPAEWIAKHLDTVMRKGQGAGTEAEFNALLDEIIALIGFTKDKDVFKAFYSSQLAKRLLLNKSASDDMERNMIIKLQREMGEEFTSGDVMMKDLQLSETMAKAYQTALAKSFTASDPTGLSANVLTESAWPSYPLLKDGWDFHLPTELQNSVAKFNEWYTIQHKNRQLSWRWQLATVTLSARFPSGKYEIGVSLFQAVVMMAFNEEDVLDFNEIKKRTGIESSELVRTLQSLSLGRKGTRVLAKKPTGKDVNPTDQFSYNKAFTSDRMKFRINQIQQDMSAEESRKTNEQVAIDRVSVLEATIVRIMKAKKKMTLQLLIDAVVTDVNKRFPPDVKEIKKRMESLIEREFLMRDENDRNLLHYLA